MKCKEKIQITEEAKIEPYQYKEISQFKKEDRVRLECYNKECFGIFAYAVLADDGESVHPSFKGNGRFHWTHIKSPKAKSFYLSEPYRCKGCGTLFDKAIVVQEPLFKDFVKFGYDPEPA
ncbi:MAG: hypothetical protein NTY20_05000 [Candidatus Aenigmarchaeota archaeon]|nr:hypothetical protein [Candidatus Aenigmarchaeota archaeon]